MNFWYDYFMDCWKNGTVTVEQLDRAVVKGWITTTEKNEIINT